MTSSESGPTERRPLEQLRVLGLCDHFTESSSGGAEKVTAEVYTRLASAGTEVRVITAAPGEPAGRRSVSGIPTESVAARDLSSVVKAQVTWAPAVRTAVIRTLDQFRPHVVHATSIHFQSALLGSAVARRRGVPVVTTGHVASMTRLPPATRWATAAYENVFGRRLLGRSSAVIAVSEAVREHLVSIGADPATTTVVPNGVDLDRFSPGEKKGNQVALVGRLIGNKGPADALEAFAHARVAGSELVVVGDGPLRSELEALSRRLGIEDSVSFLGHRNDVEETLAAAAVLVRPSMTEGQSLAILEAMATETCVIASDIPANRELLEDGRAGLLVPVGDVPSLARAIRLALQDDALRTRVAVSGRQIALGHSWDLCAERTGRVLGAVASAQSSGGR